MTIKDRILCAFGFHGLMEKYADVTYDDGHGVRRVCGYISRCTLCGRMRRSKANL